MLRVSVTHAGTHPAQLTLKMNSKQLILFRLAYSNRFMLNVLESTVRFTPLWCSDHQTAPLLGFSGRAPSDRFCISLKHNQRKQVPPLMSGYLQQHFHKAKSARDKDKARLTEEALFPLVFPTLIIAQHLQTQPGERVGSLTRSELGGKKTWSAGIWFSRSEFWASARQKFLFITEKFWYLAWLLHRVWSLPLYRSHFMPSTVMSLWISFCCTHYVFTLYSVILETKNSLWEWADDL